MEEFIITAGLMLIFFAIMGIKTLIIDKPLEKSCGKAPLLVNGVKLSSCECNADSSEQTVHFKEEEHLCMDCPSKEECQSSDESEKGKCRN